MFLVYGVKDSSTRMFWESGGNKSSNA